VRCLAHILVTAASVWLGSQSFAENGLASPQHPSTQEALSDTSSESSWLEPIPVPADPELEEQIQEVQEALNTLYQQTVRRKEALKKTQDAAQKAKWYKELETLRKEHQELEALLHDLVDEARLSEQTAIDEALARARWLERQHEQWERKEELIRDRQE
jgi:hypothetical protein